VQELPPVLVIEDDPDIQIMVEDALTDGGFEPAIAASGEEGVTLLKSGLIKYRALVTDVVLKGRMDGWEVAKQIQRDRSCLSYRLHHRGGGPALVLARSAQQHSFGKAVRASAACRCGFPSSQY
jgi:CheY-like chemotaxis protein